MTLFLKRSASKRPVLLTAPTPLLTSKSCISAFEKSKSTDLAQVRILIGCLANAVSSSS